MKAAAKSAAPPGADRGDRADATSHREPVAVNPVWQGLAFGGGVLHRKCAACAEEEEGNPAEIEAERVAEQVMRMQDRDGEAPDISLPARIPILRPSASGTAEAETDNESISRIVERGTSGDGRALDENTRHLMEARFARDFGDVRVHTGAHAETSAASVNALAYTVGRDIVFGVGSYAPSTDRGRRLLAHELTHTLQQDGARSSGTAPAPPGRAAPHIARQPKPGPKGSTEETDDEEIPPKDTMAGMPVSEIIISLSRKRVGFRIPRGMILGDVDTDLKAGAYELRPDVAHQKWIIEKPAVKAGFRFGVSLEGANPWTLSYPEKLPLTVSQGLPREPKTVGEAWDPDKNEWRDPLWLYEGIPEELRPTPVKGIDDFESVSYDLDYRSESGNLSKWLMVQYRDNTERDIKLDTITESTPRLWAAKQDALKVMDDYNVLFILGSFPTVFFIITINPMVAPMGGERPTYTATRRQVPKWKGSTPAPREEAPPPVSEEEAPVPSPQGQPARPKVTAPSGKADPAAKPGGTATKIPAGEAPENVAALTRENESAQTLAKNGYAVEQNPKAPAGSAKNPDYKIEGKYFDNFAPTTKNPRSIWTTIKGKVDARQASRIVLNLDDSQVDLVALKQQFTDYAIPGLDEVLVIKGGTVTRFWP